MCPGCPPTPAYLHFNKLFILLLQENKDHQERTLSSPISFSSSLKVAPFLASSIPHPTSQMLSPLGSFPVLIQTEPVVASIILWQPFFYLFEIEVRSKTCWERAIQHVLFTSITLATKTISGMPQASHPVAKPEAWIPPRVLILLCSLHLTLHKVLYIFCLKIEKTC